MLPIRWERFPHIEALTSAHQWLSIQSQLGLATNTVDAYGRALNEYVAFCLHQNILPETATRAHVASYVDELTHRPHRHRPNMVHLDSGSGLANATIQQRLVAVRLYYDYLIEEGHRDSNPVGRGRYTAGKGFGGKRDKGLVPHFTQSPG